MANFLTRAAWSLWSRRCHRDAAQYNAALTDPAAAQARHLGSVLRHADGSHWARAHGIDARTTLAEFRRKAPTQDPGGIGAWTDRIVRGETNVLSTIATERLVPTSGTTGPRKLIPMNRESRHEYATAVNLWMYESMRICPEILRGRAYIATSPAVADEASCGSVPVGFAEDSAYLGWAEGAILGRILAVPTSVARLRGSDWREATRNSLLESRDMRFLSLWHPSYLNAIFEEHELRALRERWKRLALVSCWADGSCSAAAEDLMEMFPGAILQPKGLWLTEGAVTVPWENLHPLAISSGFFEFEMDDRKLKLAQELEIGATCRPVLTNHAGLYRYRLGDLVRVDGFVGRTPSFRWIGRADMVSDLRGEKLSEGQVADALICAGWNGAAVVRAMDETTPPRYRCHVGKGSPPFPLDSFERALKRNPHYKWARDIGQLSAPDVQELESAQLNLLAETGGPHRKGVCLLGADNNSLASRTAKP